MLFTKCGEDGDEFVCKEVVNGAGEGYGYIVVRIVGCHFYGGV